MNKEEKQFEEKWNSCNCEGGWDYGQCTRELVGIKGWIKLNKNDDKIFSGHGKSKEEIKKWISENYISKSEVREKIGNMTIGIFDAEPHRKKLLKQLGL